MTTAEDLLSGGGAPSAKFPTPGTTIKGVIEGIAYSQQTDLDGTPKKWDDGNPRMQYVVTLVTDERDAEIPDDDGKRRLFVKGQMLTAFRDAVKASGAKGDLTGGMLAVKYTEDGEQKRAGFNPPKLYAAQYKAPSAAAVSAEDLI